MTLINACKVIAVRQLKRKEKKKGHFEVAGRRKNSSSNYYFFNLLYPLEEPKVCITLIMLIQQYSEVPFSYYLLMNRLVMTPSLLLRCNKM